MTVIQKILQMAKTARTTNTFLNEEMLKNIEPLIKEELNNQCKKVGYDGITYNSQSEDYPDALYSLWYLTSRKIVFQYLVEHHPGAWFKEFYLE